MFNYNDKVSIDNIYTIVDYLNKLLGDSEKITVIDEDGQYPLSKNDYNKFRDVERKVNNNEPLSLDEINWLLDKTELDDYTKYKVINKFCSEGKIE